MDEELQSVAQRLGRAYQAYSLTTEASAFRSRAHPRTGRTRAAAVVVATAGLAALAIVVAPLVYPGQAAPAFAGWQEQPTAADGWLAAAANDTCTPDDNGARVLVQDQRGDSAAFILKTSSGAMAICLLQRGGSEGSAQSVVSGYHAVDSDRGSLGFLSTLSIPASSEYPGVVVVAGEAPDAASLVELKLDDGEVISASASGGYWLAWWPSEARPVSVKASDATEVGLGEVMYHEP